GYHQQGDWYLTGTEALDVGDDPEFLLVAVEKHEPYVTEVYAMDQIALGLGRARNRRALEIYKRCVETDTWPGYAGDISYLSLPVWAERADTEEYL
ncbi:MAG TPA: PD-(D/E)XK nuclease-like domain-containing protein, partial [Nocardioides sp.]|nr:PD-(D/E)XK nuclease-like domain-containing protein [Nocardioides sp.]